MSGEVGGGKTLTFIHMARKECKTKQVVHNIRGMKKKYINDQHVLTRQDVFKKVVDEKKSTQKNEKYKIEPNWEFLLNKRGCTFMLDEVHELFYSRNFNSQENKAGSMIFAQIRKLCQDSGNFKDLRIAQGCNNKFFSIVIYDLLASHNNAYVTSRTTSKIEKDIRDLSQCHIHCHSIHNGEHMFVYNDFYFSDANNDALTKYLSGKVKPKKAVFYANPYFKMYDRFAIIDMRGECL